MLSIRSCTSKRAAEYVDSWSVDSYQLQNLMNPSCFELSRCFLLAPPVGYHQIRLLRHWETVAYNLDDILIKYANRHKITSQQPRLTMDHYFRDKNPLEFGLVCIFLLDASTNITSLIWCLDTSGHLIAFPKSSSHLQIKQWVW